jgi:hypothetical protein
MNRKNLGFAVAAAGAVLLLGSAAFGGSKSNISGNKIYRINRYKLDRINEIETVTAYGGRELVSFSDDNGLIVKTLIESWPTYDETLLASDIQNERSLKDKEKLMLIAIAISETMLKPSAVDRSKPDNPAKTLFQLSKKEFAESLSYFKLTEEEVIPPSGAYGIYLIPYIRNQAKIAMRFAFLKGFAGLRDRSMDRQLLGISALWTGCGKGSWTNVVNSPIVKPVFDSEGFSVNRIPSNENIPKINAKIVANAASMGVKSCTPSLLNRLMTFRQLMDALTDEVEI